MGMVSTEQTVRIIEAVGEVISKPEVVEVATKDVNYTPIIVAIITVLGGIITTLISLRKGKKGKK